MSEQYVLPVTLRVPSEKRVNQKGGTYYGPDSLSRRRRDETAYTHRDAPYYVLIVGMWSNPREDDQNILWVRGLWEAMQPFASGEVYVNFEADQGVDRVKAAYSEAAYTRLVALKNKYDPTNLFRLNQNIKPTVSG